MSAAPPVGGLEGSTIVVTGSGRGLGATVARSAAASGAQVALFDLDVEAAASVAADIAQTGVAAEAFRCDVADEDSVVDAVSAAVARFGRIDGLVNNAGVISFHRLEELELGEWERLVSINLTGVFLCMKHVATHMIEQRSGSIVTIASVAGGAPQANCGAYSPTKAGAIMLARQAAAEWGPAGIRVNAVSPGIMETPMAEGFNADPEARAQRLATVATRRFADPAEVAAVVTWLLGDAAGYVTGQNIEVDGGMMQTFLGRLPRPGTPPLR